jgi:radical SAM protein with 4Fe4S-binding SPASM domain
LTDRLKGHIQFLYFHLMGEPFLHPLLPHFIATAREKGFVPVITTNGTLLKNAGEILLAHPHKVQISIHSHEGNGKQDPETYMSEVMTFAKDAAQRGIIVVLRLWNEGGYDSNNERLLQLAAQHQPHPWTERYDGWKLSTNLYIEFDKMFEWPDEEHPDYEEEEVFCYALRNQIGVLVDGTVVPCCLDHDGAIPLGNLYQESFEEIINSPRATKLLDGFTHHCAAEPLCRKCGYAAVTKRFRK